MKHRYNSSAMGTISSIPKAAMRGFHAQPLMAAASVVAGTFATSFLVGQITSKVSFLGSNKIAKIATTLAAAGILGVIAKKVMPSRANEIFAGGMVFGVTEALSSGFPNQVKALGMSDWGRELDMGFQLDGFNDFADQRQIGGAFNVQQPILPSMHHGVADFADPRNIGGAFGTRQPMLTGLAEELVGEEIAMNM